MILLYTIGLILALIIFCLKWVLKKSLKATAYVGFGILVVILGILRMLCIIFSFFIVLVPIILFFCWLGSLMGGYFEGLSLLVGLVLGFYASAKLSPKIDKFIEKQFDKLM